MTNTDIGSRPRVIHVRTALAVLVAACFSLVGRPCAHAGIMLYSDVQASQLRTAMQSSPALDEAKLHRARDRVKQIMAKQRLSLAAAHYHAAATLAKTERATEFAREIVFHLEQALAGGFQVEECHVDLGQIYLAAGDFPTAIAHLEEVATSHPDLQLKLARALLVQGDRTQAIRHAELAEAKLRTSMANAPANSAAEFHWIAALEFLERFDEAIAHLTQRRDQGDTPASRKALSQVLTSKFDAQRRAHAALTTSDFKILLLALHQDPKNRQAIERLLVFLPGLTNQGVPSPPADFDVLAYLGDADLPAHIHLVVGSMYMQSDAKQIAERHLRTAYQQNPEEPVILNNYAWILSHLDPPRLDEALVVANQLIALAPKQLEFRESRGQILLRQGKWEAAHRDFKVALGVMEDYPDIHRGIAQTYQQLGDLTSAARHKAIYQRLIRERNQTQPKH